MTKVIYPGSFDPITKGHMNIVEQASALFDEVVVAVMQNPNKKGFFTLEERIEIIREIYKDLGNVKVVSGSGATVDLAELYECSAIVRGLRSLTDFDYEQSMQQINKEISNYKVNTVCLFADKEYQYVSSSMVKEVFSLDKDISNYVHPLVKKKMLEKKDTNGRS